MLKPESRFAGHAFVGAPLDRADALRGDADALAALWPTAQVLVLDADGTAFADDQGQPALFNGGDLGGGAGAATFLGLLDGRAWFVAEAATLTVQAPQRMDLRQAAVNWPAALADIFCYARGMSYWHSRNRFCGVCGGPVRFGRFGFIGHCDQCRTEHYPRVDPAVIVAVENNGRLLLGRQSNWVARRYSVLAGFVEPGETFEQTVAREVFEEARVRVIQAHYQGTQPWPFPGALMVGFRASAHDDLPTVDGELEDARWFSVDEVGAALLRDTDDDGQGILLPQRLSIAHTLIEQWYQSQRQ